VDTPEKPAKRPAPPRAVLIGVAVIVLAVVVWGGQYLAYALTHQTTDDARIDGDTVTITSKISERVARVLVKTNQVVKAGDILIQLDDTDERAHVDQAEAALAAQAAQARAAHENASLAREMQSAESAESAGGVSAARSQIVGARANYDATQRQVNAARAGVEQAQAQLRAAQAQVPSAKEALSRANADLKRANALVQTGDLAQQLLDAQRANQAQALAQLEAANETVAADQTAVTQAQARLDAAIANAIAAEAGMHGQRGQLESAVGRLRESTAPARVPSAVAQEDAALAQVASLRAQVNAARDQLSYTVIRAPIDGVVGEKSVEIGATVAPGQSLLQLVPTSGQYVTANFKETQVGSMHVGQAVDIDIDAYKGTHFEGTVASLGPASQNTFSLIPAQNATGNFVKVTQRIPVRIDFVNPPADKPLRVGMSVVASVSNK
jgi:membrane fusion protein (multidrug efflux system)